MFKKNDHVARKIFLKKNPINERIVSAQIFLHESETVSFKKWRNTETIQRNWHVKKVKEFIGWNIMIKMRINNQNSQTNNSTDNHGYSIVY